MQVLTRVRIRPALFLLGLAALLSVASCTAMEDTFFGGPDITDEDRLIGDGEPTVLVIGDSVMEFYIWENASIAHVIAEETGRTVRNEGVSGARLSAREEDIRGQYRADSWEWVVMDGGANDLGDECGCGACDATLSEMISPDGRRGEYPDFVRSVVADGSQVLVMGYYAPPVGAATELSDCAASFEELNRRLDAMAETSERVHFASAADVIDPSTPSHYSEDRVHPSVEGSRRIGIHLASVIETIERDAD